MATEAERLRRALERERRARKEAERLLEEKSSELYETTAELSDSAATPTAVIDAVPAKVSARDATGRYVFMNAYQKRVCGLADRDVVGRTPAELIDETYQALVSETDELVRVTRSPVFGRDETIAGADGTERTWLSNKVPVFDENGALRLLVGVSVDITKRRRVEAERNALEARLRHAQKMESLGTLAGGGRA